MLLLQLVTLPLSGKGDIFNVDVSANTQHYMLEDGGE